MTIFAEPEYYRADNSGFRKQGDKTHGGAEAWKS
jgi:hypothetical protein